ncbi:hypothetical protein B7494_g1205 [Chlorociboria aeruginascens]|nr:hypothetical protein B7494_g1205 [Chlorociboria aeruginascens]
MTANSSGIDLSIANTASPVSTPPRTTFLIASGFHSDFISNSIKSANVVTRSNSTLSNFTTSPKPIAENRGISSGDAAGIGIGTAFAGIFLALLGSWLFIKLKKRLGKWNHAAHRDTNTNGGGILAKDDIEKNNGISNSILAINYLPLERVDDSQIRKSIQDLNELILQHVENHYHKRPFQGRQEDLKGQLTGLSYTDWTEPSAHIIATLLADSRTRRTAIRQVICSTILRDTGLKSSIDTSLLPNYISAFGQEALKSVKTPGEDEGK